MEVTPSDVKGQILRIPEGDTLYVIADSRQDAVRLLDEARVTGGRGNLTERLFLDLIGHGRAEFCGRAVVLVNCSQGVWHLAGHEVRHVMAVGTIARGVFEVALRMLLTTNKIPEVG